MILPFVRELFADAASVPGFQRATTHLKGGAGRIRVSGLTPTARALYYALLQKAAARPLLLVVRDNREAEEDVYKRQVRHFTADEIARNDADDLSAGSECGVGDGAHQSNGGSAVHEADAAIGKQAAEFFGGRRVGGANSGT